jgi:azurin
MKLLIPASLVAIGSALALAQAPEPSQTPKPPRAIKLAMRDGLRFDPPRIAAQPGETLVFTLDNADSTHQPHNFIIARPGKRDAVVQQALALGERGPSSEFAPEGEDVLLHSALLAPEQTQKLTFRVPDEPGIYPYVCTFPGHGAAMYGALYVGVPMPALDADPHVPPATAQRYIVGEGRRPFTQRMFVPDAGPAAIVVALEGGQNFCWDAGQCRLRYVWSGAFIDATDHWKGNGKDLAKLPARPWWTAPRDAFPLRIGDVGGPAPAVKFLGYRLHKGLPEFHYRLEGVEVFEKIDAAPEGGISLTFRIPNPPGAIHLALPASDQGEWSSSVGTWTAGALTIPPGSAPSFTITLKPGASSPSTKK